MKNDQITSEKAINRALVHVALRWGVDTENARHNPVSWHSGSLNYYDPTSHREEVFAYFKNRGILSDGFNGAFKLNLQFDELEEAADADFDRGVELDEVVGLLISQLFYEHGELYDPDRGQPRVAWSNRIDHIIKDLCQLGYVRLEQSDAQDSYRWTSKGEALLKAHYLIDKVSEA